MNNDAGRGGLPGPAHLSVSRAIPARYREALEDLVGVGFAGVDGVGVEVHLRSRPPRTSYTVRYQSPLGALPAPQRDRWQQQHPDADTVTVLHRSRRRRDAERLAGHHGGRLERHVDQRLGERMSGCAYFVLPDVVIP